MSNANAKMSKSETCGFMPVSLMQSIIIFGNINARDEAFSIPSTFFLHTNHSQVDLICAVVPYKRVSCLNTSMSRNFHIEAASSVIISFSWEKLPFLSNWECIVDTYEFVSIKNAF